jgi:hypothetical protein
MVSCQALNILDIFTTSTLFSLSFISSLEKNKALFSLILLTFFLKLSFNYVPASLTFKIISSYLSRTLVNSVSNI